jgi:hypothetical protein
MDVLVSLTSRSSRLRLPCPPLSRPAVGVSYWSTHNGVREENEMVVLISSGFFVRASLAGLREVGMSPIPHTFRKACNNARRFGWRKKIVNPDGRSSLYL